jgi:TonB family protein
MKLHSIFVGVCFFLLFSGEVKAQNFPSVLNFVAPDYPVAVMALRSEGEVTVSAQIDASGNVSSNSALTGNKLLQPIAKITVKKWQFSEVPGNHFVTINVRFRLLKAKEQKSPQLTGYSLFVAEPLVRIVQAVSYGVGGSL